MTPEQIIQRTIELNPWMKEFADKITYECHDCGSKIGDTHSEGCDVARCKSCKLQRISCGCKDGGGDVWTGLMYPRWHKACLDHNLWSCIMALTPDDLIVAIDYSDAVHNDPRVYPHNGKYKWIKFHVPCKRGDEHAYADLNRAAALAEAENIPEPEFVSPK